MENRMIAGLLICCAWVAVADAQVATPTCDRECLRGQVTQLLYALVKHDVSGLPIADTLRVTEDAVEKPLAKVGLVGTVTGLRGFRQDIIDERAGVAGSHVVVDESGAPVLLVVRLKVVADKLTEIELVATRSRAEGLIFNIDGLNAPSAMMNHAPRPEQLAARDAAIKAAMHYPEGLSAAKTFAAVNAPFAPNAYRYENGQVMAGPDCTFAPGCQNISTQSLAIFQRLGDVRTRVVAVDERMGIVWLRMAWGVRERGGDQLTVWEMFKVYDGQIHAVEAFMRILPVERRNGGWESPAFSQAPAPTPAAQPLQPNPKGPLYRHTGEQYRVYEFPGTTESIPYRLFVPSRWKPGARLPLLVTLRAGQSVDNPYREPNSLVQQAERRGYLVVTPMGYRPLRQPYYGSKYPIARPKPSVPAEGWTPLEDERAEQDVLNVIDLVTKEYGVDTSRVYLHGQNPSGSGALHLGAKYPERFAALVISSGPIVYDTYPFDRIKGKGLLVIHGDEDTTNPMEASKRMAEAAKAGGVNAVYATVPGGTHLGAYLTYASQIFDFLDRLR